MVHTAVSNHDAELDARGKMRLLSSFDTSKANEWVN